MFHNPPMTLALASKISEVAEENGIELWHAHYAVPNAVCAILAREMMAEERRFKLVTTLHGTDITLVGSDPSFFPITKFAIERSDVTTAVSEWLNSETRRVFDLHTPIRTIYNFLDNTKFPPSATERCTLADDNEKIVMHISNFRPVKRVTDVVRAFKKISERVNAILVMVGDGPERMSAVGVARQLGVDHKIKYLGTNERIEAILPCANLVFQPSEHESFGLVPLEAMFCRVPVLGTKSGGITEVVEHGETGYLTEVGDIDAMAHYAVRVLTDEKHAAELGRKGRERANRLFSKEATVNEYERLYESLLV
jgi:N-acetyl-alpha-D-glucosaminyl L-malate synthase BshA